MPNLSNTVISGRARGGYRSAHFRDAAGTYLRRQVLPGPAAGPFTIYVPSLKPAGVGVARNTLVPLAMAKG